MRPSSTLSLAALCAGLAATPLVAQNVFTLDELVFSASLTDVARNRTGVRAIRLDRAALSSNQPLKFSNRLSNLPGIDVTGNGPIGTSTSVRIRGMSSHYTGVTINGIDVTDPSAVQVGFDFGTLGSSSISSAEIIYGSQSSINGSGSIAGSVNIETFPNGDFRDGNGNYSIQFGSYNTLNSGFSFSENYQNGLIALSLNQISTDGFSSADENNGNSETDGFDSTQLTLTSEYFTDNNSKIGVNLIYQNSNIEYDTNYPSVQDSSAYNDHELRAGRIYFVTDIGSVNHELEIQAANTERNYSSSDYEGDRTKVNYQINTLINSRNEITIGVETEDEGYKSTFGNADYETHVVYGEILSELSSALDLSMSARLDDHSIYGLHDSWRIAGIWRPNYTTSIRTSVATGYRAPSPYELLDESYGNNSLKPEISHSFELGIEKGFQNTVVNASIFETSIEDKISYSNSSNSYIQSPGTSVTQGFELGLEHALSTNIIISANYTYLDARNQSNVRSALVPRHDLSLNINYQISSDSGLTVTANSISDRPDITPDITGEDYTVVNGALTHRLENNSELFVQIQNILNEEYQTVRGYGTSDRAFSIGVRGTF
ncbi:MAG: TonB-dependent receptor [Rhodobacteraceae bacterium]|nr:TonB-dependent receptor [Paracoccaceae bacterium]